MLRTLFSIALVGLIIQGCSVLSVSTKTAQPKVEEDLTAYRPDIPADEEDSISSTQYSKDVEINLDSLESDNELLIASLDSVAAYRRESINYINGFTIQVYSGDSRSDAREEQMNVIRYFPEEESRMIFDSPNYKVRFGEYYTQMDAQPLFMRVKERFRNAILVPVRLKVP